jgi:tol-pal system protein YbgF
MGPKPSKQTLYALLALASGLAACAGSSRDTVHRLEQESVATRAEVATLKNTMAALYDRERAMADRLLRAEEASARLRQEMDLLRQGQNHPGTGSDSLPGAVPVHLAARDTVPDRGDPALRETEPRSGSSRIEEVYRAGRSLFERHNYQQALAQFDQVILEAPFSEWADNAQYWKGECYCGLDKYRQAITEFTKVFAYPKTEKADAAQIKIARCYLALGEKDRALGAYRKLLDEYPQSDYIPLAKKEMQSLRGS